jgi:hypothetical protein
MYTDIRLFTEGDFLTFRSLDGLLLGGLLFGAIAVASAEAVL